MTITRKDVVKLYVAYSLCMDSDVFIRLFGGLTANGAQLGGFQSANPVLLLFSLVLVGWTAVLLLPAYKRTLTVLLNLTWLAALYLWSYASFLWAAQPFLVIRLGTPLWSYLLCGAIASNYLTTEEVAGLIGKLTFYIAILSLIWERLDPVRGTIAPGWTGIYGEKNHLGMGMGVGIIALLVLPERWTLFRLFQILFCGLLLVESQSATAIGFVAAAVCLYALIRLPGRVRPLALSVMVTAVLLPALLVSHPVDRMFGAAGKSTTFTGRDVIWRFVYAQWATKPMLGFGYSNFWVDQDAFVQQSLGWNPNSSHNGFLETALNTGLVGEALLLGTLASGFALGLRAWRRGNRLAATWLLLAWSAMLIDDLTEADFMVPAPLWFTYCLILFLTYAELQPGVVRRAAAAAYLSAQPGFGFEAYPFAGRAQGVLGLCSQTGEL